MIRQGVGCLNSAGPTKRIPQMPRDCLSRRSALRRVALGAVPFILPSRGRGRPPPSERIHVACIGVGGMGMRLLRTALQHPDVQIVAVCDPVRASNEYNHWYKEGWKGAWFGREPARCVVEDHYARVADQPDYRGCFATPDFREVLAQPDLDAVIIATPDHGHAPITIAAARAGKDIYCEKPLSLTLDEGRRMVEAVRRYGRVLQTGTYRRSSAEARRLCELVLNGRIGRLRRILVEIGPNHRPNPTPWEPQPVPEWLDYDMWLGPAPWAPYHKNRCLYSFRFIRDYSGGNVTNLGAHMIDLVQWATGHDDTMPVEVEDLGGVFPTAGLFDVADPAHFRCRYADGTEFECHTGQRFAWVKFEGDHGWLAFDDRITASSPELLRARIEPGERRLRESDDHMRDFLDSVRNRRDPVAPVEIGHRSAAICHLGNIAMELHARLRWDPQHEVFVGPHAAEANPRRGRPWRPPWTA